MSKPVYVIAAEYGPFLSEEQPDLTRASDRPFDARRQANRFRTATSLRDRTWMKEIGARISAPDRRRPTHVPAGWDAGEEGPTLAGMMWSAAEACVQALPDDPGLDIDGVFAASMGSVVTQPVDTELLPMQLLAGLEERYPERFAPGRPRVAVPAPGTSEAGALALLRAVTWLRAREGHGTALAVAAQMMPPGRLSVDALRRVLGARDQMGRVTMPIVGDLLMDHLRREAGHSVESTLRATQKVTEAKFERVKRYPAAALYAPGDLRRAPDAIVEERERNFRARVARGWGMERSDRVPPFHRHLRVSDIAPAALGAVGVILTTDRALALRCLRRAADQGRLERSLLVAVTGVGEGSMGCDVLLRPFPPGWVESIRKAYAMTCADAGLSLHDLRQADFAVLHDAFPSIELAFLLSMGFDWDGAWTRMDRAWSNPLGGLTTFGHAVGASGLVQLAKACHILQADRHYLLPCDEASLTPVPGCGQPQERCLITSVGGPLTHIAMAVLQTEEPGARPASTGRSRTGRPAPPAALPAALLPEQCRAVRHIFSEGDASGDRPSLCDGAPDSEACYLVGRSVWWQAPDEGEEHPKELGATVFMRRGRLQMSPDGRPADGDRLVLLSRRGGHELQAPPAGASCGFSLAWWRPAPVAARLPEASARKAVRSALTAARRAAEGVRPETEARIFRRVFDGVHGSVCRSDDAGARRVGWAAIAALLAPEVDWSRVVALLAGLGR